MTLIPEHVETLDRAEILELYGSHLYRFALHRVGERPDAEQLVATVIVDAERRLHEYDSKFSVQTWLTTLMRGAITEHFRQRIPGRADGLREPLKERVSAMFNVTGEWARRLPSWGRLPRNDPDRQAFTACLERALANLPPQVAEIFVLHEQEEIPPEELAEQVGLSTSELLGQLHRARLAVRDNLLMLWLPRQGKKRS